MAERQARRGQKIKLIYIVKILSELTDEEHPLSAKEICELLSQYGVSAERKSIYDDIDCLNNAGYDIIHTRIPKNGYFLASRDFEVPEVYLLGDAVKTAKFISEKKTHVLVAKLDRLLSKYQSKTNIRGIYIDGSNKTHNEEIFYNIDRINTAIENGKKITLNYGRRKLDKNRQISTEYKSRKVSPYAMTWQDDHYYLICNYEKYKNLMHLRIDRIRSVEICDEPSVHFSKVSEYTDTFDVADYTKKLFGMFVGKTDKVKLRCNKTMLEQIADRFGEDNFITNITDNTFDINVNASISDGLVTWIMNYGDQIEVISPESLRERIAERALKIIEIYKKA